MINTEIINFLSEVDTNVFLFFNGMTGRKTVTSSAIAVYDMHQVYNRIFQIGRTQTCHDRTDDTAAHLVGKGYGKRDRSHIAQDYLPMEID